MTQIPGPIRDDVMRCCRFEPTATSLAVAGDERRLPPCSAGRSSGSGPGSNWMEDRTLLSTFLVNNTGDSGPGSLRQAILDSNAATGATNTIDFDISGFRRADDRRRSPPCPRSRPGPDRRRFSQPGYGGTPLIEINGSQAGGGDGLLITAPNVTVRGLDIDSFSPGCRHPHHGHRRHRRLDRWQLPRDRSDRHAGRAQRCGRRDRRGSRRQPHRDQWRRRQRRGRAERDLSGNSSRASGSTARARMRTPSRATYRHDCHRGLSPWTTVPGRSAIRRQTPAVGNTHRRRSRDRGWRLDQSDRHRWPGRR